MAPDGQAPVKIDGVNVVTSSRFAVRPWGWFEGNRIVYSASLGGDSWNLWEVVITPRTWNVSAEPRQLTTGAELQANASIVRGRQLVFSNLTQTVNVWSVPVHANSGRAGRPPQKVSATSALQWWPSASEDGRHLVFRSDRLATGGLWMRDLETDKEVLLVSSRGAIGPVITADGSRVAFVDTERPSEILAVLIGWRARKSLRGLWRRLRLRAGLVKRQVATSVPCRKSHRGGRPPSSIRSEDARTPALAAFPLASEILAGRPLDQRAGAARAGPADGSSTPSRVVRSSRADRAPWQCSGRRRPPPAAGAWWPLRLCTTGSTSLTQPLADAQASPTMGKAAPPAAGLDLEPENRSDRRQTHWPPTTTSPRCEARRPHHYGPPPTT